MSPISQFQGSGVSREGLATGEMGVGPFNLVDRALDSRGVGMMGRDDATVFFGGGREVGKWVYPFKPQ